ncbi:serine/threonine-protein kinase [Nocardia sp. NPDC052566]|uniref:serine/threonine-protein kinase n=1 Tax=Nocardia sp. NPDC052566 TaxID=3364330 RepID=UPI0037C858EA
MKNLTSDDPRLLGRNRLIAVIGRGGMGRVLLGRTPSGRLVAVKQIHRQFAGDPEFLARFQREVAASRQVTGAYTAAVVDSDIESENPWLATEYIPGPDLKSVVDDTGPMPLGGLRLLAIGLASALVEIHRAGLVHRDLKPANVLLTPQGPRVIDFGIARASNGEGQLTATNSMIGSPAYMSPEQAQGQELTPASDVFAVGAILVMAATGAGPWSGASTPQILYGIMHSTPDTSRVPAPLRDLVDACLAKDPAERPTAAQLREAADAIGAASGWSGAVLDRIAAHQADAEWWVESAAKQERLRESLEGIRFRRRRLIRFAAAALAAVLVVGGAGAAAARWAQLDGTPEPVRDPSLALTATELRLVDTCALLDTEVAGKLGARVSPPKSGGAVSCATTVTDRSGKKVTYTLSVGELSVKSTTWLMSPNGEFVGWTPILAGPGSTKYGYICDRAVVTQGRAEMVVNMKAQGSEGIEGCPLAERALKAVLQRLTVYVPLVRAPRESVLRVDPCAVLDFQLGLDIAGDPAARGVGAHWCGIKGDTAAIDVNLGEGTRPDKGKAERVQLGDRTVYVGGYQTDRGDTCRAEYMVRPTTGDLAEVVSISVSGPHAASDTCAAAKRIIADVIPRLPRS